MARKLAGDGDRDDRASLAAALERVPAGVEPAGAAVGLGFDLGRLTVSAAVSAALTRSGRRWCHAASTRSRRACVFRSS